MAIRKVPTIFADSESLRVSVYPNDGKFYISPGLIFVAGKVFVFEGMEGDLLPPPCIIGIKVEGTFTEKFTAQWPKHGDGEEILDQVFYDQYGLETLETFAKLNGSQIGVETVTEKQLEGLSTEEIESRFGIKVDTSQCKDAKRKLYAEYGKYPNGYEAVVFDPQNIKSVIAKSFPIESSETDYKILATFVKENLYQHVYGPLHIEPLYVPSFTDGGFASCVDAFGLAYSFRETFRDIILI
jgi:hypothetical protein